METNKKPLTEQKQSTDKELSQQVNLDKAINTLKKHASFYQVAGFTHISSLLS
jgi:hypothetical protein